MKDFKKGDKVFFKDSKNVRTVKAIPGDAEYDEHNFDCAAEGVMLESDYEPNWWLVLQIHLTKVE